MRKFLEGALELDGNDEFEKFKVRKSCLNREFQDFTKERIPFKLIGVENGEKFELVDKKNRMEIEVLDMLHSVPCVGYGVSLLKKKLKDEYKGRQGAELGQLRKQGVELEELVRAPEFFYCGDTKIEVLEKNPLILEKYPFIVIECTFLDIFDNVEKREIEDRCDRDGHILWFVQEFQEFFSIFFC